MKTFKEYLKSKNKYPSLETCFGSHSVDPSTLEEEFDRVHIPEYSDAMTERVHKVVAPINVSSLSTPEYDAVKSYTARSYMTNDFLHKTATGNKINEPETSDKIKNIDSALDKHPTNVATSVFTGLKHSPTKLFPVIGDENPDHIMVHLPAYTSTSTSYGAARNFANPVAHENDADFGIEPGRHRHILKLHLPKGTPAMSVMGHTHFENEKEILVGRGHNVKINTKPEINVDGVHIWHGTIVSRTPHEV